MHDTAVDLWATVLSVGNIQIEIGESRISRRFQIWSQIWKGVTIKNILCDLKSYEDTRPS
jgi:hypothetical protein